MRRSKSYVRPRIESVISLITDESWWVGYVARKVTEGMPPVPCALLRAGERESESERRREERRERERGKREKRRASKQGTF